MVWWCGVVWCGVVKLVEVFSCDVEMPVCLCISPQTHLGFGREFTDAVERKQVGT